MISEARRGRIPSNRVSISEFLSIEFTMRATLNSADDLVFGSEKLGRDPKNHE